MTKEMTKHAMDVYMLCRTLADLEDTYNTKKDLTREDKLTLEVAIDCLIGTVNRMVEGEEL